MSASETPPIRNFERLVQYAQPGKVLVAGSDSGSGVGNVYPEWSEGTAASGSIIAWNGLTFAAMTVGEAAAAAGESLGASGGISFADADPRYINASGDVMEGHLFQPTLPTASGHLVNKAYVDAVASGGGGGAVFLTATVDLTLTDVDTVVFVDSTSGPVDVELPATHTAGRKFEIKDFGAVGSGNTTTNLVRIVPTGGAALEGSTAPHPLTQDKESATIIGNGSNWGRV